MNLLTHFKKITILRFVLAGLVLLFLVPALFADGIASRYPNDVGIENDPEVILYDGFESYTDPREMKGKWNEVANAPLMRIATEPGNFFAGKKSLEMHLPITSTETGVDIAKKLLNEPVLYVRTYEKWDPGYDIHGSGHNGITIRGSPFLGPGIPAPKTGTGFFDFLLQNNFLSQGGENQPGYSKIYAYWPHQRINYGDHWLPNGWVVPYGWGDWILYPSQYPNFVAMPNWQPLRGVWYCHEFLVKLNTVGQRNGVVAFWINGQLKGRWTNLFIRSIDSLKINTAKLSLSNQHSYRVNKKWYDNVVIARSYIGPISPPKPISRSRAAVADFNSDGSPDYVLQSTSTRQTAIWYLNNNVFVSAANGPTLPGGWNVIDVADFNLDGNLDYALFNASTRQTAIWYLSGVAFVRGAPGPTLPSGWTLLATADFNGDGKPDYVLFNPSTRRTAIWYLNNNIFIGGAYGPTLP